MTKKLKMPDSMITSGIAWSAVNHTWFTNTRNVTPRPAAGSDDHAPSVTTKKRASAPKWESRRAARLPNVARGAITPLRYYPWLSCCKPCLASVYSGKISMARLKSSVARSLSPRSAYRSARE